MDVFKINPLGKKDGDAFTRIFFKVAETNIWRIDKGGTMQHVCDSNSAAAYFAAKTPFTPGGHEWRLCFLL